MSVRGSAHASLLLSSGTSADSIGWYVAASLVIHVLFFVIVTYLPDFAPKREFVPSVIMVNMVTMSPTGSIGKPGHPGPEKPGPKSEKPAAPDPGPAKPEVQESRPEPPAPKPAKPEVQEPKPVPPAPKPEKVSVPEPQPHPPKPEPEKSADVISLSNEKPKIKTSLKKETFKSNQAIKNALNRIEKQVEETKPVDPLASALDRIKSKVEKTESETGKSPSKEPTSGKSSGAGSGSGAVGGSGGGAGGTGGTGAFGIQPIDFYRSLIPNHIEHNWVFNEQLVGGRTDLVSVIVVKIMKNGEITDIWFEKKSGNSYFDDSVYKAVKKSNPLPPLPREYMQPYYELGLIFTPKGLKRS
jgi:colicin import membrane protein